MDGPGTTAVVGHLPVCHACALREGVKRAARYDTRLVAKPKAVTGLFFAECFAEQGPQRLGTGIGQFLLTDEEIPPSVKRQVEDARAIWEPRLQRS